MIRSMTAFVIKRQPLSRGELNVNLRSTNFKYLDIYISRIPAGAESLESEIFREVTRRIRRGRIEISLWVNFLNSQELTFQEVAQIKKTFILALKELIDFKKAGGEKIEAEIKQLGDSLKKRIELFKEYLRKKVPSLKEGTKEDILEEVALISFYLAHLERVLTKKKARPGKILDFLCQELLREISTILAKIKDKKLSLEAIYFKEEVDRIRELAQNIE